MQNNSQIITFYKMIFSGRLSSCEGGILFKFNYFAKFFFNRFTNNLNLFEKLELGDFIYINMILGGSVVEIIRGLNLLSF